MAVVIDEHLSASPSTVVLKVGAPGQPVVLRQTLHSDLGGEAATITYHLDQRHNVFFQTPKGQTKQTQVAATIPGAPTGRKDRVTLVLTGSGTSLGEIQIKQVILAETTVYDSVTLVVSS